jgi:MoaA/NifB/PqqE/SkfB family radical SAM enzyme
MGILHHLRNLNEILYPRHLIQGPTHIVLGVNNFCNLKCLMCDVGTDSKETNFGGNLMGSHARSMPLSLFQRIVDQIADFCPEAHLAFAFTEPLAWAPMGDALRYAQKKGILASVTTNGLLLPKRAKEISGLCANLSVSLDGPEPVHDHIRQRTGSYARAVQGIEELASIDPHVKIGVFCTITEWNASHLVEFLSTMSTLPIHRVGLTHNNFVTSEQARKHNVRFDGTFHATPSNVFSANPQSIALEALSQQLDQVSRSQYPFAVNIQPHVVELRDLKAYYHSPETALGKRCRDANRIVMIDSDGEAVPAHGRCFRFPIANIREVPLSEIWNHPSLASLRRALADNGGLLPACTRCCGGFG